MLLEISVILFLYLSTNTISVTLVKSSSTVAFDYSMVPVDNETILLSSRILRCIADQTCQQLPKRRGRTQKESGIIFFSSYCTICREYWHKEYLDVGH